MLAGCGLAASALLLALKPTATDGPASTLGQLAVVLVAMAVLGRFATRRAMDRAVDLAPDAGGSGEPTPLWLMPLIVAALTVVFGVGAGWDAGLRVGGGCAIVGLVQAVLLERIVAANEARSGRRYHRVPGSSILTGTRLGSAPAEPGD